VKLGLVQAEIQSTLTRIKTHPVRPPRDHLLHAGVVLSVFRHAQAVNPRQVLQDPSNCGQRDVHMQGVLGTLIVDHNGTVLDHELQVRTAALCVV
jgi:hypothetical protein